MNNKNTLIILDWDDTLFPTTWTIKKKINLNNKDDVNKYIVFFSKLDLLLCELFKEIINHGHVVIVTNAMIKWINISLKILPNTKNLIDKNVKVYSAREKYQNKNPNNIFKWKQILFQKLLLLYSKNNIIKNIISIGDAEYEFRALINLYNRKRILKSIRFMAQPEFDSLMDQLNVLKKNMRMISRHDKHLDLKFDELVK